MAEEFLFNKIANYIEMGGRMPNIPSLVEENIPSNFKFRPYQERALKYFIHNFENSRKQIWNLFHMATGSGKTNLMASLILYLYGKGYRNFIFFVNSVNIVEKTKDNFLNKDSKKYLFSQKIVIDKKTVEIVEVNDFADSDENSINIMFTTIQGLHDNLNSQRENSVSFSDFENKKVVLIADEAHHFSASTRNLSRRDKDNFLLEERTWEDTISRIYHFNRDNVLLEFTATCDLTNRFINDKYKGNPADIIFNYPLLAFRRSGYTKDLMNLQTNLSSIERTIQALLLSQYRLKIFEKNGIANSKPVVLLKADGKISDLEDFYDLFVEYMNKSLNERAIKKIENQATGIIKRMFDYYKANNITYTDLVTELKLSFSEEHIIKVHSKIKDLDKKQSLLNNLENPSNPYRLIMTLDMLHEGWDVLNLFDIVRLYDVRKDRDRLSKTTIQEAQLIGRGARYYPFKTDDEETIYKRKFDSDLDNEMRICETLYYHCIDNSKYISDLRKALKELGYDFTEQEHIFEYKVKDAFKETDAYKKGKLFLNKQEKVEASSITKIPSSFSVEVVKNLSVKSITSSLYEESSISRINVDETINNYEFKIKELASKQSNLVLKSLRQFPVYRFDVLKQYFPNLQSHHEFITSDDYAGRYEFCLKSKTDPTVLDIYEGLLDVFEKLGNKILSMKEEYKGTREFNEVELSKYIIDTKRRKTITGTGEDDCGEGVSQNSNSVPEEFKLNLSNKDWFVYNDNFGTTEEKRFVKYFSRKIKKLKEKYDEVYLIRNERNFHIYSFDEGKRFEPDYILILSNNGTILQQQQIFIEPKGRHLVEHDKWKQEFLLQLEQKAECVCYHNKRDKYKIIGLPFYTHDYNVEEFDRQFKIKTGIDEDN